MMVEETAAEARLAEQIKHLQSTIRYLEDRVKSNETKVSEMQKRADRWAGAGAMVFGLGGVIGTILASWDKLIHFLTGR